MLGHETDRTGALCGGKEADAVAEVERVEEADEAEGQGVGRGAVEGDEGVGEGEGEEGVGEGVGRGERDATGDAEAGGVGATAGVGEEAARMSAGEQGVPRLGDGEAQVDEESVVVIMEQVYVE